tara:strand:- start:258 stop:1118 length:861 start_codon:yes stop_codon:yes gene_type:complete
MKENIKKFTEQFKIILFHVSPLHFISDITFKLSRIEEKTIKNVLIRLYIALFKIKLDEYLIKNISEYKSLNDFFIRELDMSFREDLDNSDNIISPCDGTIAGFGNIDNSTFIHAKKYKYSINELINEKSNDFNNGKFINIYLEPKDCHRIYMPCDADLIKVTHVPGKLYSVAPYATYGIKNLYSKNERVILNFSNKDFKMSMIMVGAVNVGCITLSDYGIISPAKYRSSITEFKKENEIKSYKKGDEIGMFNLGSTVILLFSTNDKKWVREIILDNKVSIRNKLLK